MHGVCLCEHNMCTCRVNRMQNIKSCGSHPKGNRFFVIHLFTSFSFEFKLFGKSLQALLIHTFGNINW